MEAYLAEKMNFKQVAVPSDAAAGLTGARIKLDKGSRMAILISMGDSTGAGAVTVSFQQHDAASAGNSKALSVANPYYHKVAAASVFTKVQPSSAASSVDVTALFASDEGLLVVEVLAEQLDVNNGYYWFSMNVAATTAAKIVGAVYVAHDAKNMPAYELAL